MRTQKRKNKTQKQTQTSKKQLITDKSFIALQAFMINDLGLYGDELLVYAKIFGLCKYVGVCYALTVIEELSKWLNKSTDETINIISSLYNKNLIGIIGDNNNYTFNVNLSKIPKNELYAFNNVSGFNEFCQPKYPNSNY